MRRQLHHHRNRFCRWLVAHLLLLTTLLPLQAAQRILFYGPSLRDPAASEEAAFITAHPAEFAPMGVADKAPAATTSQVWSETDWVTATVDDFKKFDAIVFSDKQAGDEGAQIPSVWPVALESRAIWGSAISGNVLIVGGDPAEDAIADATVLSSKMVWRQGIRFAAAQNGASHVRTGLYIALDHNLAGETLGGVATPSDVPILSWFGSFKAVRGGGGVPRLVTDIKPLNLLGPDVGVNWDVTFVQGFQSWPSGFYPVASTLEDVCFSMPATPAGNFTPPVEADTGYKHKDTTSGFVTMLAKSDPQEQKYLTAQTPNQAVNNSPAGTASFWVDARFREDPSCSIYVSPAVSWRVVSGPNVGRNGSFTRNGMPAPSWNTWTASYIGNGQTGQDVVRIFYDYDNDKVFDDFAGNNNGNGDPTNSSTQFDFGITVTVNWHNTKVSISAVDATAAEANDTGTFRITRTGSTAAPLVVTIASATDVQAPDCFGPPRITGIAYPGSDYVLTAAGSPVSALVTIPAGAAFVDVLVTPVQDTLVEGTEIVKLSLVDSGSTPPAYGVTGTGYATIADDDQPTVSISSAASPTAAENGPTTGAWVISRGTAGASPLDVYLTLTVPALGGATPDVDFTLTPGLAFLEDGGQPSSFARATIPANSASVAVTLTGLQDSRTEGTESVTLALKSHVSYKFGTPTSAAINLTDDAADVPRLPPNGYTLDELTTSTLNAYALNDANPPAVVGSFTTAGGYVHGFKKQPGGALIDLGVIQKSGLPGSVHYSYALGINNSDRVVGNGYTWNPTQGYLPYYFSWLGGLFTELAPPSAMTIVINPSGPQAINDANWSVGSVPNNSGTIRAGRWDSAGAYLEIGKLGSRFDAVSYAWAINQTAAGNRVAGQSQFDLANTFAKTSAYHAYRTQTDGSGPQPINGFTDDLGNALASSTSPSGAYAINALGEVAGFSAYSARENRAAYKDANSGKHKGWRTLGVLAGGTGAGNASQALGLNNTGLVVGWSRTTANGSPHAVVWENYQTPAATDLNGLLPPAQQAEWVLQSATAINQNGDIAGYGVKNSLARAFLLRRNP